jgi:lipopolysaccharide biosynthesis glycosyltransferase
MNILVAANDNYIRPLFVMLESLFENEKEPMNIYLFYSDVSDDNLKHLEVFIKKHKNRFSPVFIKESAFDNAPTLQYISKESYYRILCSELLPETEDRVLYLDADILIRGSIRPLYNMDFSGKSLIAVSDYGVNHILTDKKKKLGFKANETYINSGVILFNLEKMRQKFDLDDFLSLLVKYKDLLTYYDQDMINLYFKGDIKFAEEIYNYRTVYGGTRKMLRYLFGKQKEKSPVIVHYMCSIKPWMLDYYWKYFFEYFSYLKKYLTRKEKLMFALKPFYVLKTGFGVLKKTIYKRAKR